MIADALGIEADIWFVAGLTALSGLIVAMRMYETHQRGGGATTLAASDRAKVGADAA